MIINDKYGFILEQLMAHLTDKRTLPYVYARYMLRSSKTEVWENIQWL